MDDGMVGRMDRSMEDGMVGKKDGWTMRWLDE